MKKIILFVKPENKISRSSKKNLTGSSIVKIIIKQKIRMTSISKNAIKKYIFLKFSLKASIKSTGASKILHLINLHIYMTWDTKIKKAYHKSYKRHRSYDNNQKLSECYLDFLKLSQEIIKTLLYNISEDDLWKEHQKSVEKEFFRVFSFRETILKMLDEVNYIRFTKGVTII